MKQKGTKQDAEIQDLFRKPGLMTTVGRLKSFESVANHIRTDLKEVEAKKWMNSNHKNIILTENLKKLY